VGFQPLTGFYSYPNDNRCDLKSKQLPLGNIFASIDSPWGTFRELAGRTTDFSFEESNEVRTVTEPKFDGNLLYRFPVKQQPYGRFKPLQFHPFFRRFAHALKKAASQLLSGNFLAFGHSIDRVAALRGVRLPIFNAKMSAHRSFSISSVT